MRFERKVYRTKNCLGAPTVLPIRLAWDKSCYAPIFNWNKDIEAMSATADGISTLPSSVLTHVSLLVNRA